MNLTSKYPNISFYIITIFATGVLFALTLWLGPPVGFNAFQWGPAISAYIVATLCGTGISAVSKNMFLPKIKARWLLVSAVFPVICVVSGDIITRILLNQQFSLVPGSLFTGFMIVFIFINALTEEIGWRGFMLPGLIKRYGNLKASVILGILWGLWHMGDYGEGLGFLFFVSGMIGQSIIMTWLHEKGNGSVLTAWLFHSFLNLAGVYFGTTIPEMGKVSPVARAAVAFTYLAPAIILVITSPVFKKRIGDQM